MTFSKRVLISETKNMKFLNECQVQVKRHPDDGSLRAETFSVFKRAAILCYSPIVLLIK
jgi:hypothetical protein